jgi:hypothetical protein
MILHGPSISSILIKQRLASFEFRDRLNQSLIGVAPLSVSKLLFFPESPLHGSLRNRSTRAREPAQFSDSLPMSLVPAPWSVADVDGVIGVVDTGTINQ